MSGTVFSHRHLAQYNSYLCRVCRRVHRDGCSTAFILSWGCIVHPRSDTRLVSYDTYVAFCHVRDLKSADFQTDGVSEGSQIASLSSSARRVQSRTEFAKLDNVEWPTYQVPGWSWEKQRYIHRYSAAYQVAGDKHQRPSQQSSSQAPGPAPAEACRWWWWWLWLLLLVVVVVVGIYCVRCCSCVLLRQWTTKTRHQVPEIINHPYYRYQLTSWPAATAAAEACCWWWLLLLLIVVMVAMGIYMSLLFLLSLSNSTWYVPDTRKRFLCWRPSLKHKGDLPMLLHNYTRRVDWMHSLQQTQVKQIRHSTILFRDQAGEYTSGGILKPSK